MLKKRAIVVDLCKLGETNAVLVEHVGFLREMLDLDKIYTFTVVDPLGMCELHPQEDVVVTPLTKEECAELGVEVEE